ncbi:MAG: hypothetical protein KC478_13070 [Bacteriovoracaceae bacterium]|nr:hypothetical protein [Bacteriovoracaceae bacterium]
MKILSLIYHFVVNIIYLTYMTFIEGKEFDFEMIPFGKKEGEESTTPHLHVYTERLHPW